MRRFPLRLKLPNVERATQVLIMRDTMGRGRNRGARQKEEAPGSKKGSLNFSGIS
jgi:hypothetical protein